MRFCFFGLALLASLGSKSHVNGHVQHTGRSLKGAKASKARKNVKGSKGAVAMKQSFNRISTFPICSQIDINCDTDVETVAEIAAISKDGLTVVYTDSEQEQIGCVNITDPSNPLPKGTIPVDGEPTSVAILGDYALVGVHISDDYVNTSGKLEVISLIDGTSKTSFDLGGQPDSVVVSPDGCLLQSQ